MNTAAQIAAITTPVAELTRAYLEAKAMEKAAREEASKLEGELLSRLDALGRKGVEVPGLGKVAYVGATMSQGLDVRAAEALLVAASIELPLKLTERRASLRSTLNV